MSRLVRRILRVVAPLALLVALPAYLIYAMMHVPEIDGPKICPLPNTARGIFELRLALPASANLPEFGALAAWADQAGHGHPVAAWAQNQTTPTDSGGLFSMAPIMSWVSLGARGSHAHIEGALAQIVDAHADPRTKRLCADRDGQRVECPAVDHNTHARASVLHNVVIPAMMINGRMDEALEAPPGVPEAWSWRSRFLISRGEFDKAVALYRRSPWSGLPYSEMQSVAALAGSGQYDRLDGLLAEERVRTANKPFANLTLAWRPVGSVQPLHDALRQDDVAAAEAFADSLANDSKKYNERGYALSALLAYYLRQGNWKKAQTQLEAASEARAYLFGRPPHEAWLTSAAEARRGGNDRRSAHWKLQSIEKFCALNPNQQDPKVGGVQGFVTRFLHSLYVYTAVEEGLLPQQPLVRQPIWRN